MATLASEFYNEGSLDCRIGQKDKRLRCEAVKRGASLKELRDMAERWDEYAMTDPEKTDPGLLAYFETPVDIPLEYIQKMLKVPPAEEKVAICAEKYSYSELRLEAQLAGLSTGGTKEDLCRRLIEAEVIHL